MESEKRPWYKEPYVLMLIGIPLSSVIMGIFFISLAVNTKDSLVRDNYYKDGLAMNQELKWDKKAKELDIRLGLTIEGNLAKVSILNNRQSAPSVLKLQLSHPTLKEKDRDALLQFVTLNGQDSFQGFIDNVEDGRYYIQVEAPEQEWRLRQDVWIASGQTSEF